MKPNIPHIHINLKSIPAGLRHFLLGKTFTSIHGVIQIFAMLSWLLFLTKTDAYYVVYLLVGVGGLFCRQTVNDNRKMIFFRSERLHVGIAALFSIAVMSANYPLFENHLTIATTSSLLTRLFGSLELAVRFLVVFLGGLYVMYFIVRWIALKAVPFVWATRHYESKPMTLFLGTFALFTVMYSSILFLCFYPGVLTYDSIEEISQILSNHYSNHHPYYYTAFIGWCMKIGKLFSPDINVHVACYSFFSILLMAFTFAYTTTTLYQLKISMKIVIGVMAAYLLLPYHIFYSFTMWKDTPFGAFALIFTVSVFRLMQNVGKYKYCNAILTVLGAFGICLFRSNGLFAFIVTFLVFVCFYGKRRPKICLLLLSVIVFSWILKYPVLKALHVTQPDTIESLSIPAQQIARVVTECDDLTQDQKELISRIVDIEKIPDIYTAYISDPIKEHVRQRGRQQYLVTHKRQYLKLYIDLGLSHPKQYFEAWVEQTKGYWNAGYPYWQWRMQIRWNKLGITRSIQSVALYGFWSTYSLDFPQIEWLTVFLSIGLHTWCLLLITYIGFRKKDKLTVFLTVPVIAVIGSLLIATPVYSEFRYAYSLFCCLPFLAVTAFRQDASLERKESDGQNESIQDSGAAAVSE